LRDERVRREQSANAAADNYNVRSRICHKAPWLACIPATSAASVDWKLLSVL
jgi:hypothetical protein